MTRQDSKVDPLMALFNAAHLMALNPKLEPKPEIAAMVADDEEYAGVNMIFKTVAGDGGLEFVLSDETVDRYGDVIVAAGWVLANFKKNPIALFGHSSGFPIGTWANLRIEGSKLIGTLQLAARGTSARIDELISLVEQGVLRAVSVGFIPIKSEPINPDRPYGPQKYTRQELLETSLVSVPANPAALALAKTLNISDETMSLAFGEQAEVRRQDISQTGEHATSSHAKKAPTKMKTLAQRIEDAQNDLVAKRDKLTELNGAESLDLDAIEELTGQIEVAERTVTVLKASEAKIGTAAVAEGGVTSPAVQRRPLGVSQKDVKGLDLVVRGIVARGISPSPRCPSNVCSRSVIPAMKPPRSSSKPTRPSVQPRCPDGHRNSCKRPTAISCRP